jgi:primosomal protein N' (replication factor Y)
VLPDVTGVHRIFSYAVPPELDALIQPGVVVRVPLGARRVRGWVVEEQSVESDLTLRPILAFVSFGATSEILELANFGVWRYAGRLRAFLVAATPPRNVRELAPKRLDRSPGESAKVGTEPSKLTSDAELVTALRSALAKARTAAPTEPPRVLRLPPATPRLEIVASVRALLDETSTSDTLLVLLPEHADVERLVALLRRGGDEVATYPEDWIAARSGARVVVGTRSAVLAPLEGLGAILVLDAEAEAYVNERTPTWRADVLAAERARRGGVPCLLVSSTPSLDVLDKNEPLLVSPLYERAGWPLIEVIDRRGEDPRAGLFAQPLAEIVRQARAAEPNRSVVAVLNRTGRARLLACRNCGLLVGCERCGAALIEAERLQHEHASETVTSLACPRCSLTRPMICSACHSTRLKTLRIGVARAAEEFSALIGEPAAEITGATSELPTGVGLLVGTEAVLHRVRAASLVVMLDFDQELGAKWLRGAEHALGLIARAGRLVGGRKRTRSGFSRRVVIQTRTPDHVVIRAALAGDPGLLAANEAKTRAELHLPPFAALALVSGEESGEFVAALADTEGIEVGAEESRGYLLRAESSAALADALAIFDAAGRQVRVEVDPEHV